MKGVVLAALTVVAVKAMIPIQGIQAQQPPAPELITDPDAYAIYARLDFGVDPVVVLRQETSVELCPLRDNIPLEFAVWQPVIENYYEANGRTWSLVPSRVERRVRVLPAAQIRAIINPNLLRREQWQRITDAYTGANGYWWVSAVGFDTDHTNGYAAFGHLAQNGMTAWTMPFEKTDGAWQWSRERTAPNCTISID
jgi:hypothetical protein